MINGPTMLTKVQETAHYRTARTCILPSQFFRIGRYKYITSLITVLFWFHPCCSSSDGIAKTFLFGRKCEYMQEGDTVIAGILVVPRWKVLPK
jgi:hypothetical protein